MIDTLFDRLHAARERAAWLDLGLSHRGYLLATLHRPALVDTPALLARTLDALNAVSESLPVVFPVHPRTRARLEALGQKPGPEVTLLDPQPYLPFLSLQVGAAAVVTDSGGVQEEATALGVPCFTLRANTERPVTVTHGTNTVLGLEPDRIAEIPSLLAQPRLHSVPPLWDGRAGERAASAIESFVGLTAAATTPLAATGN
jgi:UDP-N-acetylglucosamine 2-epimerase (non-hydrolysing)